MDARKVMTISWFYIKTFLRGLVRILGSTLVSGAAAVSVYGFTLVTNETGYTAVSKFVASCVLLVIALVGVYAAGQHDRYYKKYKSRLARGAK